MDEKNGRTHEPSLREVTVELDGLVKLYEERDRRYEDRFKAQETAGDKALAAAEKLTAAAFAASKEAITKAEEAQRAYNVSHNDLIRKMDAMIPRTEFDQRFRDAAERVDDLKKRYDLEIADLRESRSMGTGQASQRGAQQDFSRWLIGLGIMTALSLLGSALAIVFFVMQVPK